MLSALAKFFGKVEGSIKGVIVPEELFRALLTSLGSGTIVGLLIILAQGVQQNLGTIFPDPTVASLASMMLTLVLDLLRRQSQGSNPSLNSTYPPV